MARKNLLSGLVEAEAGERESSTRLQHIRSAGVKIHDPFGQRVGKASGCVS